MPHIVINPLLISARCTNVPVSYYEHALSTLTPTYFCLLPYLILCYPRCTNVPVSYYEHALDYAQWVTDINTFIVQPGEGNMNGSIPSCDAYILIYAFFTIGKSPRSQYFVYPTLIYQY